MKKIMCYTLYLEYISKKLRKVHTYLNNVHISNIKAKNYKFD